MNTDQIKKLREETGAGVMECRRALLDAKDNYEKAKVILASSALAIAKKKADRATNHGLIEGYVHAGKIGVLVEASCESDFVAKNPIFKEMAHQVAMQIASMNPENVEELLEQEFIMDSKMKVSDYINSKILVIKENMKIKRFIRFELGEILANNES